MNKRFISTSTLSTVVLLTASTIPLYADTFGSGGDQFDLNFVPIGNPGNSADTTGYGAVSYSFNMSVTEVSQAMIDAATDLGVADLQTKAFWSGNQSASGMTWYQEAAFVNWLNISTGHQAAYNLTDTGGVWSMSLWSPAQAWQAGGQNLYRNANAYYFLPSENEWYKAAFYDPNKGGSGIGGYWKYATGSDTAPTAVASGTGAGTAVYNNAGTGPADVSDAGGLSPYGTEGQDGNVREVLESSLDGTNSSTTADRTERGGSYVADPSFLAKSYRGGNAPTTDGRQAGFRVASVPEPSSALLMVSAGLLPLLRRRRVVVG